MTIKTFRNSDGLITHYYDSDGALQFTEAYIASPGARQAHDMPIMRISSAIYRGDKTATYSRQPIASPAEMARAASIIERLNADLLAASAAYAATKPTALGESATETTLRTLLGSFKNFWSGLSHQKMAAGRHNRQALLDAWEQHLGF